ncbi:molybdenum cofactor biosynthesis protein B [Spiribacter roseus]|uniref:molybdenum cofactor biosynthesis protein B n=1 Tax=Spiribacter roseus TaxID=1855875 RepID=UPI0013304C6B|nr:molybdenum cofactor biosynthesis protein B [Spiribacter roseus]KAF0282606.1 molybdenum cofactor biosynthesis protein B [Spiribacter roseus]
MTEPREFTPLSVAVLTVSDTRTAADDRSGQTLRELAAADGHRIADHRIVTDDRYAIRAVVSAWISDPGVHAVICTGGTGFSQRDVTPEAIEVLFDRTIPGFGERFRQLSHASVGSSTLQSRALAGIANRTLVVALPGSTGACRDGWSGLLSEQLDVTHRPCNLAELALGL